MKTITIQIGNTDHKLTQDMWAAYVKELDDAIHSETSIIHFKGGPPIWEKWQNCCWVVLIDLGSLRHLLDKARRVKLKYSQDSIAWTEGETTLI